ncbi:MAG: OstA-like protein [Balneolaceae bacterium]
MKYTLFTGTSLLLIILLLSLNVTTMAQSRIDIITADQGMGGVIDGETVRILLGNVRISTDRMILEADSLYQFTEREFIHAFNLQIETEDEIIWADSLIHNTQTDYSEFRGRVVIQSEKNTVFSESVDIDMTRDIAIFRERVRFEDESGILVADSGLYYQQIDSAIFRGNVQLADTTQYLEADSLFMNRSADFYKLYSRVYADDFEELVTFSGNYLEADSTGYRLLSGNAWMMRMNESQTDTTHLLARKIEVFESDTASVVDAFTGVKIWSPKFSALGDTAKFRDDTEQFFIWSNPIVWQKRIQLTGPYIEAHFEDDDIRFLQSYPKPIAVQQDSITNRLNQMTGDTLHAFFEAGDIKRIHVFDNTEIIFHQKDENGEPDGLIEMFSAGPSFIDFYESEVDEFKSERNIDGTFFPENPVNIERKLDNFRWDPEMRPQRPAIREPRLPQIPAERPFDMPPRYLMYLEEFQSGPPGTGS